jgi:hypothetical protein
VLYIEPKMEIDQTFEFGPFKVSRGKGQSGYWEDPQFSELRTTPHPVDWWDVVLPHQCDEWQVAYGDNGDKAKAVREMEKFIQDAMQALGKLREL